jgi:hypothetical protein
MRHEALAYEMAERGYKHQTPLEPSLTTGKDFQDDFVNSCE